MMTVPYFVDLTTAEEAAFQIALKYHPKEKRGTIRIYVVIVKREVHAAMHTFYRYLILVHESYH